jgi:hypothetical protein
VRRIVKLGLLRWPEVAWVPGLEPVSVTHQPQLAIVGCQVGVTVTRTREAQHGASC